MSMSKMRYRNSVCIKIPIGSENGEKIPIRNRNSYKKELFRKLYLSVFLLPSVARQHNRWAICLSMREENQYGDIY